MFPLCSFLFDICCIAGLLILNLIKVFCHQISIMLQQALLKYGTFMITGRKRWYVFVTDLATHNVFILYYRFFIFKNIWCARYQMTT